MTEWSLGLILSVIVFVTLWIRIIILERRVDRLERGEESDG